MEKVRKWQNWLLVAVCIVINLIGRNIAAFFGMPFWLDAIGTLISAIVLGPIGGSICGLLTNAIVTALDHDPFAYAIVSVGIGAFVGYFFPKAKKYTMFEVVASSIAAGLTAVILSTPLNMIYYDGRTGNIWGDALIDMLSQDVNVPVICTVLGEAFVDIPDKALSVFIGVFLIKVFKKLADRRKNDRRAGLLLMALALLMIPCKVKAADFASEYAPYIYTTDDGLDTVEINAVAQTEDGFLWVGTYAGLYRFNGARFEEIILDDQISNVMQLEVDSEGRLWIGTNDKGIACYDPDTNKVVFYSKNEGLSNNSVRAICEDKEGNIYVGTAVDLCRISKDGKVSCLDHAKLNGVRSLSCNDDGIIAGVTTGGALFFIRDEKIVYRTIYPGFDVYYTEVAAGRGNTFLIGTSDNYVALATFKDDDAEFGKKFTISTGTYFNKLKYSEKDGGYFYCCENGIGFITNEGRETDLSLNEFSSSASDVIIDYQGNIWFVSAKQGIVRYAWNPFQDMFTKAKVPSEVVNCVHIKNGLLYVGTNEGLITIDLKTYYAVPIDHPELFENVRIRDILEDKNGNLWISTYGKSGLIELRDDGTFKFFNESTENIEGGRFRTALELSDGTIVAATSTGLNYIRNNRVEKTMGEAQGIQAQILCMIEIANKDILAGTDGDGIYIIRDGEIISHYKEESGLDSLVVLKIVPCGEGEYIYVTSNSLYYCKDNKVKKLSKFPYRNNYDVYFTNDGDAWVTSSAGIFVANKDDLLENGEYNYTLLNKSKGLYSSLVANSRNAVYGDFMYLCCSDGVRRIPAKLDHLFDDKYNIRVGKVLAGSEEIKANAEGEYIIPAISGRIQFDVAVLNYTLSNPLLHIYLDGIQDDGIICSQKDIQSLSYMNLPYGDYGLHVEVLDTTGSEVIREEVFKVRKESQLFERVYFKIYLFSVCVLFVIFIVWLVGNIRVGINSIERWQKEAKIDPMTGFFNKGYSQQELEKIVAKKRGILMMIDLDNFKLINDLHGHTMGDKVLTRFAELVRSCIREDDFTGRIGGDEFVVFIHGASDEGAVAEKARYLNEEIVVACRELIGEDFDIPLSVSIGAVQIPDEGTEYTELFRKADKALYSVKQNGKHGYMLYKKAGVSAIEGEEITSAGLAGLRMILGERGDQKGAYLVDFEKLQMIYRLFVRMSKRTFVNVWIVQFAIFRKDEGFVEDSIMEKFIEVLSLNLRSNDVVAANGKNKVIIIMTDTSSRDGMTPVERIVNKWDQIQGHEDYVLSYETEDM